MRGILNINKESSMTSFDVVARLRHLLHEKRIGHGGTLDPLANGVLPVFIGNGTRVSEYMLEHPKRYTATIKIGYESNSYDADGEIKFVKDTSNITKEMIEPILNTFVGEIMQIPPLFSAIKKNGVSSYKAARNGESIELEARPVTIYECNLIEFNNPFITIDVKCARGTYIRSIAHDLGEKLGCGGYIEKLTRTEYGPFTINESVTLSELETIINNNDQIPLFDIDKVLTNFERLDISDEDAKDIIDGKIKNYKCESERLRIYNNNKFLAILLKEGAVFKPSKVFID